MAKYQVEVNIERTVTCRVAVEADSFQDALAKVKNNDYDDNNLEDWGEMPEERHVTDEIGWKENEQGEFEELDPEDEEGFSCEVEEE